MVEYYILASHIDMALLAAPSVLEAKPPVTARSSGQTRGSHNDGECYHTRL